MFVAVLFLICFMQCMYVCVDKDFVKEGKQKYNDTNVMAKREMNTNVVFDAFLLLPFYHSFTKSFLRFFSYSLNIWFVFRPSFFLLFRWFVGWHCSLDDFGPCDLELVLRQHDFAV